MITKCAGGVPVDHASEIESVARARSDQFMTHLLPRKQRTGSFVIVEISVDRTGGGLFVNRLPIHERATIQHDARQQPCCSLFAKDGSFLALRGSRHVFVGRLERICNRRLAGSSRPAPEYSDNRACPSNTLHRRRRDWVN